MPPAESASESLHALQQALAQRLGPRRFQQWFGNAVRFQFAAGVLGVAAPSTYLLNWIEQRYRGLLQELAGQYFGAEARVEIRLAPAGEVTLQPAAEQSEATLRLPSVARETSPATASERTAKGRRLHRLSDFVTGSCNDLAHASAVQFASQRGECRFLYLQSHVGNGKTHLLEGILRELRQQGQGGQALLLGAEQFTSYFTQAMSARSTASFRARFQGIETLLIDDIDFLDGKRGTQDEFLQICKNLEAHGGQVIVAGNRHPRLLTKTSDELISRFQSGLVCRIEAPCEEVRREIIIRHAQRQRLILSEGAREFIVSRFNRNVRELIGAVNVLTAWSRMSGKKAGTTAAREVLGRLERDCLKVIRVSEVEEAVCDLFSISADQLRGPSRRQSSSQPRMLAMYLARRLANVPYSEIGEHFGRRNHSTVMAAEKKVQAQLEANAVVRVGTEACPLRELLRTLEDRIRAG